MARPFRPNTARYYTVTHAADQTADWKAFYDEADRRTAVTQSRVSSALDIAYGSDPKHYLDVYGPSIGASDAPVYLFIHGGGFREGDRAHYGFIAEPLAMNGIVTVVPSYRLLPEVGYFDCVADIRSVIEWIATHIGEHGGAPRRIIVGGHSAGGVLAAFVAGDRTWLVDRALIGGLVSMSVGYDFTTEALTSYVRQHLGNDAARAAASPLLNIREPVEHAVVAVGANEAKYVEASRTYADALDSAGASTELIVVDGMGHDGIVLSLAEPDSQLTRRTLELLGQ